ncbi:MAG: hypothetical protein RIT14_2251 [Pseudomonadota bacterium]
MLWDVRARMKPALAVIDLIPHVHRTPALAALRRAVLEGRPLTQRLSADERALAFHEAQVPLTSPIGARVLLALYHGGHLKLKKPAQKALPALEAYAATEAAFRADVARIEAEETARRDRLAAILADPDSADDSEITPALIDRVVTARLGHAGQGMVRIAGLECHRSAVAAAQTQGLRAETRMVCWWIDRAGQRQGEAP